jgi:hypothetical protein
LLSAKFSLLFKEGWILAKYKHYSFDQQILIPVNLHKQVMPGTIEYTLNTLIDEKIDLSIFNDRYKNDKDGESAYDPRILFLDNSVCLLHGGNFKPKN